MDKLILILFSFVIGVYCVKFIRSYDMYEKEPVGKMGFITFWGGVCSIFIATILYTFLASNGYNNLENFFGAFFIIGPVEEFAKLFTLYLLYPKIKDELNEPIDGIIYMSCVALGFSLVENIEYAIWYESDVLVFTRLFFATPMHICFSAFMGLSFYMYKKNKNAKQLLIVSFIFASIAHGTYDLVIFNGAALIVLLAVMWFIYLWAMDLLSFANAQSPFKVSLLDFISNYKESVVEDGLECLSCGSKNAKMTYKLNNILIQKCDKCEHYVSTKKTLKYIFQYFGSIFKKIPNNFVVSGEKGYFTIYQNNYFDKNRNLAFFQLDKFSNSLEMLNKSAIEKIRRKWWFPKGL